MKLLFIIGHTSPQVRGTHKGAWHCARASLWHRHKSKSSFQNPVISAWEEPHIYLRYSFFPVIAV